MALIIHIYRHLAKKENSSPLEIDMTSFDFIISTCGNCHPGGGPLEYDRNNKRYDLFMKENNMLSGGDNGFDGDYYKARWIETGVIEADCLLCHLPEYNFKERNKQIQNLNFKWSATAGANFANVEGSIKEGKPLKLSYNLNYFDQDGKVSPHIVLEPRNSSCLNCHAKPGWKKRGASFSERTDVHIRAGLKCVDCHPAGSKANDKRIKGKEIHQFGKGDDSGDGVPEVNRGEEIEAFIRSVEKYLKMIGYNLERKKIVWVNNDLIYYSKDNFKKIEKYEWEASPYTSVFKFSHNVA